MCEDVVARPPFTQITGHDNADGLPSNASPLTLCGMADPALVVRNTCSFVVGRLLEIRVAAGYHAVQDVDEMMAMMRDQISRLPEQHKFVIAADWRRVGVMPQDTAERAREMLARSNPRVVKSSILIDPSHATTSLQVVRLVKEAENANRRHFTDAAQQIAWLSDVLTAQELQRLRVFLALG